MKDIDEDGDDNSVGLYRLSEIALEMGWWNGCFVASALMLLAVSTVLAVNFVCNVLAQYFMQHYLFRLCLKRKYSLL